jgi:hypothetical protein
LQNLTVYLNNLSEKERNAPAIHWDADLPWKTGSRSSSRCHKRDIRLGAGAKQTKEDQGTRQHFQ